MGSRSAGTLSLPWPTSGPRSATSRVAMDHVLLGNSFLTRFSMRRDNDILRLEKRP